VVVAALAVATWVFVIVPLWRRCRPRLLLLNKNKSLKKRLGYAAIVILVFAVGLWTGWHKDEISTRLRRRHGDLTGTIASPSSSSPSPAVTTATSPVESAPPNDIGGNPEGSLMDITEVKTTETPDSNAEKNIALQIGIK
jgi:hypothetical protein